MAGKAALLVVLAFVLLGGARDAAPARGQEEVITAVGSVSDYSLADTTVRSSRVELTFPAGGGQVTGEWRMSVTFISRDEEGRVCTGRSNIAGPLEGTYDGSGAANGLNGRSTDTVTVTGCGGSISVTNEIVWSAGFDGDRVSGTITEQTGIVITFTAQVRSAAVPPVEDVPDASDDAPDTADDIDEPPDGAPDIAGIFFGTEGLSTIYPRALELLDCSDAELEKAVLQLDLSRCAGAADASDAFRDFRETFNREFPNPSEKETRLGNALGNAIVNAGIVGKDGNALFPSIKAALPLIARLADNRTTYTVPGQDQTTAVERFIELLAARDAFAWEERFP